MTQNATLSAAQRAALDALAQGHSISAAARMAGVDRSTIHRWLRKPGAFSDAVVDASAASLKAAAIRLAGLTGSAADVLFDIMTDAAGGDNRTATARLRAADAALGHAVKLAEVVNFDARIAELEKRIGEMKGEGK